MSDLAGMIGVLFLICFCLATYFLPTFVALFRKHKNVLSIFLVNIFFGWTMIGWVLSLVWGCSDDIKTQNRT